MSADDPSRRRYLGLASGLAAAGLVGSGAAFGTASESAAAQSRQDADAASSADELTRDSYAIAEGTDYETTVYVVESETSGPTATVLGGFHGNEQNGVLAAHDVREWTIDAGTLVVVPESDRLAVEDDVRSGPFGDLNRQFPIGEAPESPLAEAIWETIVRHDTDLLLNLHSSTELYSAGGWGQAIFYAPDRAAEAAERTVEHLNDHVVPGDMPDYEFTTEPRDVERAPTGLVTGKAAYDRDIESHLIEITSDDLTIATQVEWTKAAVRQLLSGEVLLDDQRRTAPTPAIETTPDDAASRTLDGGTTVTLDGSASSYADGEIESYEWDVDGDGEFERSGETADVTLDFCGSVAPTLRVTTDDGETATTSVTLSTV